MIADLPDHELAVYQGSFSPDRSRLVAVDCSRAWLFDEALRAIRELEGYAGHAFRFQPGDGRIFSSNEVGVVLVWDISSALS